MACVFNCISRFAVPCFVMLSGAFILDDERTADYKRFYQKRWKRLGLPTIIFSILYVLYQVLLMLMGRTLNREGILNLIKSILCGQPFYHMWYVYMMFVIYLLAPVVIRFKNSIPYSTFRKVAYIFLAVSTFSGWSSISFFSWSWGSGYLLGYFCVGYVLRKDLSKTASVASHNMHNVKGSGLILVGILIELGTAYLQYRFWVTAGTAEGELKYAIVSPICPQIVLASLLIFAGFSMLRIRHNRVVAWLSGLTFIIYLFHAGVWNFIYLLVVTLAKDGDFVWKLNSLYWIPVFTVLVFGVSIVLSRIYLWVEKRVILAIFHFKY